MISVGNMKKKWIALGLILIFSGLIMIPTGANLTSSAFVPESKDYPPVTNDWSISGYFEANRKLTLSITPNDEWAMLGGEFYGDIPPEFAMLNNTILSQHISYIYLRINITDPKGGITSFCALYFILESSRTWKQYLALEAVAVSSNDGGLKFPEYILSDKWEKYLYLDLNKDRAIFGITSYNGTYRVHIKEDPALKSLGPPLKLELRSERIVETHPYYFLVPVGGVIASAGVFSSIFGMKATTKPKRRKKRIYYIYRCNKRK